MSEIEDLYKEFRTVYAEYDVAANRMVSIRHRIAHAVDNLYGRLVIESRRADASEAQVAELTAKVQEYEDLRQQVDAIYADNQALRLAKEQAENQVAMSFSYPAHLDELTLRSKTLEEEHKKLMRKVTLLENDNESLAIKLRTTQTELVSGKEVDPEPLASKREVADLAKYVALLANDVRELKDVVFLKKIGVKMD